MTTYLEKLKDPRWQKKRLEVFERDKFTCQVCLDEDNTLHVHHRYYNPNTDPWDYPLEAFSTLCEGCHRWEKDTWLSEMQALSRSLKKLLLSCELEQLGWLFDGMKFVHAPITVINAVEFLLKDESKQKKLVVDYLAHLKSLGEG